LGYYTRIDLFNVQINPEHRRLMDSAIAGQVKGTESFRYMLTRLTVDSDGELEWTEGSVGTWRHDEEFVAWLAPYCSGGFVSLWGQEGNGDSWPMNSTARAGSLLAARAERQR
jgi:hypothetical protein